MLNFVMNNITIICPKSVYKENNRKTLASKAGGRLKKKIYVTLEKGLLSMEFK